MKSRLRILPDGREKGERGTVVDLGTTIELRPKLRWDDRGYPFLNCTTCGEEMGWLGWIMWICYKCHKIYGGVEGFIIPHGWAARR